MKQKTIFKYLISVCFGLLFLFAIVLSTGCESVDNNSNNSNSNQTTNDVTKQIVDATKIKMESAENVTIIEGSEIIVGSSYNAEEHLEMVYSWFDISKAIVNYNLIYKFDAPVFCSYAQVGLNNIYSNYIDYTYPNGDIEKAFPTFKIMLSDISNSKIELYCLYDREYDHVVQFNKVVIELNSTNSEATKVCYFGCYDNISTINKYAYIEYNVVENTIYSKGVSDEQKVETVKADFTDFDAKPISQEIISNQLKMYKVFGNAGKVLTSALELNSNNETLLELKNAFPTLEYMLELNVDLSKYIKNNTNGSKKAHFEYSDQKAMFTWYNKTSEANVKTNIYGEYILYYNSQGEITSIKCIELNVVNDNNIITETLKEYSYVIEGNTIENKTITTDNDTHNELNTYKTKAIDFDQK